MKQLKSTKKWLSNSPVAEILLLFISWRLWITLFALFATLIIPLESKNFLGGGFSNYRSNPVFWSWANFDGEHYLAIAHHGYERLNHSFFPVYPYLMRLLDPINSLEGLVWAGLMISNVFFILSLYLFWKLMKLDYRASVARNAVLLLVLFPTSFYFGAVYTESLFLLLALSSFYSARRGKWWLAGILGTVASGTRIIGVLLLPALLLEYYLQHKKISFKNLLPVFLVPAGLLTYMWFLQRTTGNPLAFYNELSTFGVQREGNFVLLPQVFYRYFKMLATVNRSDPFYLTLVMEFSSAVLGLALLWLGYVKRIRWSYLIFAFLAYLLPTFTGSFSSLPRYFLVIFPFFILLAVWLEKRSLLVKTIVYGVSVLLLIVEVVLFARGYWVA